MLSCLIYLTLTFLIPLRLTYHALKAADDHQQTRLWSSYWAIYSIILLFKSVLPLFTYQPFELILVLFHLWLYAEQYRGALLLSTLITRKIEQFNLKQHIDLLADRLAFLGVFESKNAQQEDPKIRKIE